jgi:hypothetical protein
MIDNIPYGCPECGTEWSSKCISENHLEHAKTKRSGIIQSLLRLDKQIKAGEHFEENHSARETRLSHQIRVLAGAPTIIET